MRRLVYLVLSLLLVCAVAQAQITPPFPPGLDDLNTAHPLARGLLAWWIVLPPTQAGPTWWDRMQRYPGTLTNMDSGFGWQPTSRGGWYGEMRFDGVVDGAESQVNLGTASVWDFLDTTWTVHLRFRSTNTGNAFLITKRGVSDGGGWFIRLQSDGSVRARIYGSSSAAVAAERSSVATGLNTNAWHSVTAIFTSNTVTQASNTITVYVDGVLDQGSLSVSGSDAAFACTGCPLTLGADYANGGAPLPGALDDIRIWTRALTAAEVLALHRATPPTFDGLLAAPEAFVAQDMPRTRRRVVIQ